MDEQLERAILHLYCIVRFAPLTGRGWTRGRKLEQLFSDYCLIQNFRSWHGPYHYDLFGSSSATGLVYELDGGISFSNSRLSLELKAYEESVPREQMMIFNQKTLDFYLSFARDNPKLDFYRAFVSDTPLDESLRRFCFFWRIIPISPDLLPPPALLKVIRSDTAQSYFSSPEISEAERVLGPLSDPLNSLMSWDVEKSWFICPSYALLTPKKLDEAIEVHSTLSQEILGFIEEEDPEFFENLTFDVLKRMDKRT